VFTFIKFLKNTKNTESTTQSTEKPSTTESTTQSTTERPSNTERTTQLTTEKLTTTERPTQPTPEKPIRATEQTKITKNPSTRKQILTENNKVEDMVTKPKLFTGTQANTVKPKELTTEFPETTEKLTTEITQKIVENIIPITTTVYKKLDEKTEPITEKRVVTLTSSSTERSMYKSTKSLKNIISQIPASSTKRTEIEQTPISTQIITETTLQELVTEKIKTDLTTSNTKVPEIVKSQTINPINAGRAKDSGDSNAKIKLTESTQTVNLKKARPLVTQFSTIKVTTKRPTIKIITTEKPITSPQIIESDTPAELYKDIRSVNSLKRARKLKAGSSRPRGHIVEEKKIYKITDENKMREQKNNKVVENMAKIYGIKMQKRETPWEVGNKTFTTPSTIKENQGNLNTKLQFLESYTAEIVKKSFDKLWVQICDIHNKQIETAKSMMTIDPTLGARLWLRQQDITAKFHGEAIGISKCHQVAPHKIFWQHEVGNECYEKVPVEIKEGNISKVLFLVSESYAQDLVEVSEKIECSKRPKSVFKDENGKWRTYEGPTSVESMPNLLPYKPERTRIIFKAETIFQSDLNGLMASISVLHNYANRINKVEKILKERNITYEANPNILVKIGQHVKESAETGIQTAINLTSAFSFLTQNWLLFGIIILGIVSTVFIIGLIIYIYPWIQPFLSARSARGRNNRNKIEEMEKFEVNALRPEPSAPPTEIEMEAMIHSKIPKIYQVSHFSVYSIHPQLKQPLITLEVGNNEFKALADSGASISYCKQSIAKKLGKIEFDLQPNIKAVVANNDQFFMIGKINIKGKIGDIPFETKIYVAEDKNCPAEILLGSDFWENFQRKTGFEVSFDWVNDRLKLVNFLNNELQSVAMVASIQIINQERKVKISEKVELDPHSDTLIPAEIEISQVDKNPILIKGGNNKLNETLIVGKTLCEPNKIFVRMLNVGNSKITLYPKQKIAEWEEIDTINQINSVKIIDEKLVNKEKEYLLNNLNLEDSCLSEGAKEHLKTIINNNSEAFVGQDGNIGHFKGTIKHRIDLIDEKQIVQQRPYRVPPGLQEEVHNQIHEMLRQKIIRPSDSVFASPIVLVKKKDGKYRMAIDYRRLNQNTKKQVYFLPLISDILDRVGGKSIFTCFDFMSGFHQIGIEPDHIERTAFATFCGIYEFLRMPFGLCGAPCTFMKVMECLRKELSAAFLVYIDDVILASLNENEHLKDIEKFLKVLIKYNLKLKLEKCSFGKSEIKYLGFLISAQGIRPDPKNIAAVQRFEPPKTLTELRSFIGAVSYFRRFIKGFAEIMAPLHELTKIGEGIEKNWKSEHQKTFENIKNKLIKAPVLASPNFKKSFIVETDASKIAIAGCLLQKNEDGEHPITFISKKLTQNEQKFTTAELEALAIVYSLDQFRPYIEGTGTTLIRTDNSVACALMRKKDLVGRMAKYQLAVQAHDIKIEHRSGKTNKFCDHLSRYPAQEEELIEYNCQVCTIRESIKPDWEKFLKTVEENIPENQDFELPKEFYSPQKWKKVTNDEIRNELSKDRNYLEIIQKLQKENIPENENDQENFLAENEKLHESYSIIDGILYKWLENKEEKLPVIVVPYILRERIIRECHEDELIGGHLGIMKTLEKIRKRFWWKRIIPDTKNFVTACIKCQQRKSIPKIVHKEPIYPIEIPTEPFHRIHMDILGPLPETAEGFKYILSITDAFSKWLIAVPMINQTAISVSQAFVDNLITKFGCPKVVITDNGRQFISKIFEDLSKIYGFKHKKTTTYHPQSNGAVERMNRVIADMMYNYVNIKGTDWASHLQHISFAYNSSIHASSGQTPYFILFARDPITPIDLRLKGTEIGEREIEISEYLQNKRKIVSEVWESVKESLGKSQISQKKFADAERREHNFEIFELVLIQIDHHAPENYHKFRQKWSGPFRIIKVETPVLTLEEVGNKEKVLKIHVDKVKKFLLPQITPLRRGSKSEE